MTIFIKLYVLDAVILINQSLESALRYDNVLLFFPVKGKIPVFTLNQCCFLEASRSQWWTSHQHMAVKDDKKPPSLDLYDSLQDRAGNHMSGLCR